MQKWKGSFNPLQLLEIVFHPFVFVALQVVVSLGFVKGLALPEEVVPVWILLELCTAVALAILFLLIRNIYRAGVACSLALGLFFYYRLIAVSVSSLSEAVTGKPCGELISLVAFAFLSAACIAASTKQTWVFGKNTYEIDHVALTKGLNVISVLLLAFNAFDVGMYEGQENAQAQQYIKELKFTFDDVKFDTNAPKPDVYYMIVDGFPHRDTMKEVADCQDFKLYDFLQQHGFYVVPCAASNYDRTEYSLSSSLNMQFINPIADKLGKDYTKLNLFARLLQNDAVVHILKQRLGYKFINVSSAGSVTDCFPDADQSIRSTPLNHFVVAMMALTPVWDLEMFTHSLRDLLVELRLGPGKSLHEAIKIPGPKFVFAHTDISHAPVLFDENGNRLPIPSGHFAIDWGTPPQLCGQWKYSQTVVVSWLDDLLKQTQGKAVIIVQSDHGPGIFLKNDEDRLNERMRILNAYYFPGKNGAGLYKSITPVNTFRCFFNDYFQAHLPMLPDDVWWAREYGIGLDWTNVRKRLRFNHADCQSH